MISISPVSSFTEDCTIELNLVPDVPMGKDETALFNSVEFVYVVSNKDLLELVDHSGSHSAAVIIYFETSYKR
jgi:hypothetical protein